MIAEAFVAITNEAVLRQNMLFYNPTKELNDTLKRHTFHVTSVLPAEFIPIFFLNKEEKTIMTLRFPKKVGMST